MTILTPAEVARILAVSEDTVTGLLRGGQLPGIRVGRLWRIPLAALEDWVQAAVDSAHGQEAAGESERRRDRVPPRRQTKAVAGGARRRLDSRRATDPPQPLRVVGAGGEGHAR